MAFKFICTCGEEIVFEPSDLFNTYQGFCTNCNKCWTVIDMEE